MTILVRQSFGECVRQAKSAHAGLLLTRGLPVWEDKEKTAKAGLIDTIVAIKPCSLYEKAFVRWQAGTADPARFSSLTASIEGRMMIGLSTGGAMETGVTTHHTYGMPMIPGSSVKGAVRAYAHATGIPAEYQAVLFGADEDLAQAPGVSEGAGCLVWHDAWWSPDSGVAPFVGEVVTVHHQEYYGGKGEATDFDSPVPNQQLAVQGSFYFVVEGPTEWATLAQRLLRETLTKQGIGAKRAAGYGFLTENKALVEKQAKKLKEAAEALKKEAAARALEESMTNLTANQRIIQEFRAKLTGNSAWQNGNPGMDPMGFGALEKTVAEWTDPADLKFAFQMFDENLKLWLKKPWKDTKWKERMNTLKQRAGL